MVSWITCHPTNEGDINNLLGPANSGNQTGDSANQTGDIANQTGDIANQTGDSANQTGANNTFNTDQNTINRLLPNDTPLVTINVQEPQNINNPDFEAEQYWKENSYHRAKSPYIISDDMFSIKFYLFFFK
jgi:hypothetical protein